MYAIKRGFTCKPKCRANTKRAENLAAKNNIVVIEKKDANDIISIEYDWFCVNKHRVRSSLATVKNLIYTKKEMWCEVCDNEHARNDAYIYNHAAIYSGEYIPSKAPYRGPHEHFYFKCKVSSHDNFYVLGYNILGNDWKDGVNVTKEAKWCMEGDCRKTFGLTYMLKDVKNTDKEILASLPDEILDNDLEELGDLEGSREYKKIHDEGVKKHLGINKINSCKLKDGLSERGDGYKEKDIEMYIPIRRKDNIYDATFGAKQLVRKPKKRKFRIVIP